MNRIIFLKYSEEGNCNEIKKLLANFESTPDLLAQGIFKLIHNAKFSQIHLETISTLIHYKANLTLRDSNNMTSLMLACNKSNFGLVSLLLNSGANPHDLDGQGRNCISIALMNQVQDPVDILAALDKFKVQISQRDFSGAYPIHYAAKNGHSESIKFLLAKGADVNLKNMDHDTPLHLALRDDRLAAVRVLWAYAERNEKNFKGKRPLDEVRGKCLEYFQDNEWESTGERTAEGEQRNEDFQSLNQCSSCKLIKKVLCSDCLQNTQIDLIQKYELSLNTLKSQIQKLQSENSNLSLKLENLPSPNIKQKKLSTIHLTILDPPDTLKVFEKFNKDISLFITEYNSFLRSQSEIYSEVYYTLKDNIENSYKMYRVELFGSYSTGLILPHSDLDVVVIPENKEQPIAMLDKVLYSLSGVFHIVDTKKVYNAKFPLLAIKIKKNDHEIKIDVSAFVPNHKGQDCTKLVNSYLESYPILKLPFLILKQLLYFCEFHEPFKGGLSSYGLFLMLIYYYQEQLKSNALKSNDYSLILFGFLDFYTESFNYKQQIAVDYELWDNRQHKYVEVRAN